MILLITAAISGLVIYKHLKNNKTEEEQKTIVREVKDSLVIATKTSTITGIVVFIIVFTAAPSLFGTVLITPNAITTVFACMVMAALFGLLSKPFKAVIDKIL